MNYFQLAPPPTPLQSFEYHWKHVKNFYSSNPVMPKVHIENTNLPIHLEAMLKLLIDEANSHRNESLSGTVSNESSKSADVGSSTGSRECFQFVLTNRPFDLLTDICLTDSPPGASVCILNWMRRFLTCLEQPRLDHKSILQPIQVNINKILESNACSRDHCFIFDFFSLLLFHFQLSETDCVL